MDREDRASRIRAHEQARASTVEWQLAAVGRVVEARASEQIALATYLVSQGAVPALRLSAPQLKSEGDELVALVGQHLTPLGVQVTSAHRGPGQYQLVIAAEGHEPEEERGAAPSAGVITWQCRAEPDRGEPLALWSEPVDAIDAKIFARLATLRTYLEPLGYDVSAQLA